MTIAKVSSSFKEGVYRIFKVFQFGAKTADECSPFGFDGNPIEGMDAIFSETSAGGEPVIVGYIQTQRLANPGECRLYALNKDEQLSTYIWLRKDGTIEFGGNDEHLVKYSDLEKAMLKLKTDLATELSAISAGISSAGGAYMPGQIDIDITDSKTKNIKIRAKEE